MSLTTKLMSGLISVFALYALIMLGFSQLYIRPTVMQLEQKQANNDLKRARSELRGQIHQLERNAHIFATWQPLSDYINNRSPSFAKKYLSLQHFKDIETNVIYVLDRQKNVVWGKSYDLKTNKALFLQNFTSRLWALGDMLFKQQKRSGLMLTDFGPLLIATSPIQSNKNQDSIRGTLIIGRFLDKDLIQELSNRANIHLSFWPLNGTVMSNKQYTLFQNVVNRPDQFMLQENKNTLQAYSTFPDIQGAPTLLMSVKIDKSLSKQVITTGMYFVLSIVVVACFIALVIYCMFNDFVAKPVRLLKNCLVAIREGRQNMDAITTLAINQKDEIGELTQAIDQLVEQLHSAKGTIIEQSYYSGLSEFALDTIMQISHKLKPALYTIESIAQKLRTFPIQEYKNAQRELQSDSISAERKKELQALIAHFQEELQKIPQDLSVHLTHFHHEAKKVVDNIDQQHMLGKDYTHFEDNDLQKIITDVIHLISADLRGWFTVNVDPQLSTITPIRAHIKPLRQLFVHLITNAAKSLQRQGNPSGRIRIVADSEKPNTAHIKVIDNGPGISAANLETIFQQNNSKGATEELNFGLHWCKNIVTAMDGELYASSQGIGRGATFHLIFPIAARKS